jgi:hypothetical protein
LNTASMHNETYQTLFEKGGDRMGK